MKTLMRAALVATLLTTAASVVQAQPAAGAPAMPMPMPMTHAMPAPATTLSLGAYGEVRTTPDMATITLGVTTEGATAVAAMRANSERMNQVVAALRRGGLGERDIQTSGLNLNPQYVYEQNQPPRLTGYQASNMVTIRVMDLARLGPAIDAAVASGANQMHGISFGLKDPDAAENEARRRAVRALQGKAGLYAQATGLKLGRLVNLSEGGGYNPPQPMPLASMARMEKADSVSISPGEVAVRIDITALYELNR